MATATVLGLVVAGAGVVVVSDLVSGLRIAADGRHCVVRASGEVVLDSHQMANAATIAAIGLRRAMPERAVVVALATAFQESKLKNLEGGDRDSIGLFQQRPSMGWGSPQQIRNPRYAARRFYQSLAKVDGWQRMRVTDAAQKVQRSAYPEAYQKWADEAEVLTRALTGRATGAVACSVPTPATPADGATDQLTQGLLLDWGQLDTVPLNADAFSVPVDDDLVGWRYAHWLVSHAAGQNVSRVAFAGQVWTAREGRWLRGEVVDGPAAVVAEVFPSQ
ncbi:hypothetical protein [Pilimelia columellifera]|uniref:Secreted protein n=1 Tax=Pilimelia columellifera subsp. columellifera TaxID=706583 RepID=A0ABN3NQX4_9ACTN